MLFPENDLVPNNVFILNVIDHLNDKTDNAVLRGKGQLYSPLKGNIDDTTKGIIKNFNMFGIPILVIIFGLIALLGFNSKKKKIEIHYSKGDDK